MITKIAGWLLALLSIGFIGSLIVVVSVWLLWLFIFLMEHMPDPRVQL